MNDMRIYVASLYDYNDGRLEGKWLDLSDYSDASELMDAIQEMLDELTEKYKSVDGEVREEFAVHDYEGIPSTLASEYMGEQDFQQLYDIAEVADDKGIPVEVLIERAGDTGSDDYQALADSLMFVVDGYNESDIVAEYESQLGDLGSDFWSNHIYIDDVTERVMYGEDVDRFREDILYENPDLDEDEAERQAEEMADEEAERREDLTTYLEDMGYGDSIPDFVSKDYEGAWKRSLSYDFDVINHDGEMYVFSNNYSLGGTILSGVIGAYIGYKIGRAKPQKKGFETEKKIGRKIKGAFSKKKMAKGGGVEKITQAEWLNQNFKEAVNHIIEIHKRVKLKSGNELLLLKKESGWGIAKYNPKTKKELEWYRYADKEIANYWIDKVDVDKYSDGGSVEDFSEFDFQVGDKLDLGSKGIKYFKQYDGEKIIVVDSKSDLKTSKGTSTYPSSVKKVLNRKYAKGGEVDGLKKVRGTAYYVSDASVEDSSNSVDSVANTFFDSESDFYRLVRQGIIREYYFNVEVKNQWNINQAIYDEMESEGLLADEGNVQLVGYELSWSMNHDFESNLPYDKEEEEEDDNDDDYAKGGGVSYNKNWEVVGINKYGKMFKERITLGRMSDKEDVKNALRRRTDLNIREVTSIKEVFAKGGGIGFKGLSSKVAKRYEGKSVAPKYQSQYGTTYSKSEAKEVGDKVAGKVYWNQQGRKMAEGGNVNMGRSWHQDRRMHNKSERYEKPMNSRKRQFANGGGVEYVSWEITFFDRYDTQSFVLDVQGDFDNEQDAIDEVVREYDIYVDKDDYGQMYYNGNPVEVSDAKRVIEHRRFKKGGGVGNKKEWIAIYSRGNGQQIVVVKAKDKSEAYREAEMSRGHYKLGSDWQMIDIYESQYAKGGGISGLDDLLRG